MVFRNSRLRFCFAGVDPVEWEKQASERTLRRGGISAASALRSPPRTYPCRRAKSDVREPIKRGRRSWGVAMATYEDTNRSGRKICTIRYLRRAAMDSFPRKLTCRAEKEPSMASQLDHAPRRQCCLGHYSGGVDRTYGETTGGLETSDSVAVVGESARKFTRWNSSAQADRKPRGAKYPGDDAASAESALFSLPRIRPLEGKEQTSAKSLRGGLSATSAMRFPPVLT